MPLDPVRVREATADDLVAAMTVLDGAALAVDAARVRERIAAGDALVAVADDRVLGALVLDPAGPEWGSDGVGASSEPSDAPSEPSVTDAAHVVAVAVRRRRRDQGVGTALVEAAAARVATGGSSTADESPDDDLSAGDRAGRLTAAFAPAVRPFYESLGFAVTGERPDGRLTGVLERG